jgi:ATP-dependent helicase/nuclease subunit A
MEPAGTQTDPLTNAQAAAVQARGNVLVMAGAGTGKTKTLVARCLDCLERERASLDEMLIVTFTEAAATEMRLRLRRELEKKVITSPGDDHWPRQLALFDTAHIGTLHSFCFRLVREHFHEAGLDPQLKLLDEGEARQLASETLEEQFQTHYAGEDEFSRAVQDLIQTHGNGRDESIRDLVLRLHHYSQTRQDAADWLARQRQSFSAPLPTRWLDWLLTAVGNWRDQWREFLERGSISGEKTAELAGILRQLPEGFARNAAAKCLAQVLAADNDWPKKDSPRKSLETFFGDAAFLNSLAFLNKDADPLVEDWKWIRGPMETLLRLTVEFAEIFSERKRTTGVMDFHDLEQSSLQLLWNPLTQRPSAIASYWRQALSFVFVDEYQDINAAQDKIIAALARDGTEANRFLVGDVKQSIYRFRLANPQIFRQYAREWQGDRGRTIALTENFRSREGILNFVNSVFCLVMREEIGGVTYEDESALRSGHQRKSDPSPEPLAELLLRLKIKPDEAAGGEENGDMTALEESAKEARVIARHLMQLVRQKHLICDDRSKEFRAVKFGDMAILMRSPRGKEDIFTREFARAGVPLSIAPGGFYESPEILDLLSLLQLLDNPLQDAPCIAVLRSPLVGLSLNELAKIRLNLKQGHFWTALVRSRQATIEIAPELSHKLDKFLSRFSRWRKLARQVSLSQCLEQVLAETAYDDWLKTQPRGGQRAANLELFLRLTQQFDQFQRQGLFRFLKFVEAQRETEAEPEVAAVQPEDAVRLMSIHQSKGLEFPVVVVAGLDKKFNEQDLRGEIILDDQFGLCPRIKPPTTGRHYPSLPHWLAQKHQKRELRGEELRLLYVAMTRARDLLVLSSSVAENKWETVWKHPVPVTAESIAAAGSFAEWLGIWFAHHGGGSELGGKGGRIAELSWRLVEESEWCDEPPAAQFDQTGGTPDLMPGPLDLSSAAAAERLHTVLSWEYSHAAATTRAAKASVTELRRAAERVDDETSQLFAAAVFTSGTSGTGRLPAKSSGKLTAAEIGAAHHKFLQQVSLEETGDLETEAERLVREHFLTLEERAALDFKALAKFWDSSLGRSIRALPPESVIREMPFTAGFRQTEISAIIKDSSGSIFGDEFIVVQGVADLVAVLAEEVWLVDFKTDKVFARGLSEKKQMYEPQLQLYAAALQKIFTRPVTKCALYFLTPEETIWIRSV